MSNSIKISPKHGLNPSIVKCFWCGEECGIALCGKLKGDKQAPHFVIQNYEPCDKCVEHFKKGILLAGCTDKPVLEEMPPICSDENGNMHYPDGSHIVLTEQGVERILNDQVMIDEAKKNKVVFMPSEIVHQIVEDANKLIEEEKKHETSSGKSSVDTGEDADEENRTNSPDML